MPYFHTDFSKFLFASTCIVNFILFSVDPTSTQAQIFEINADKSVRNGRVFRSEHTYVIFKRFSFSSSFDTDITPTLFPFRYGLMGNVQPSGQLLLSHACAHAQFRDGGPYNAIINTHMKTSFMIGKASSVGQFL